MTGKEKLIDLGFEELIRFHNGDRWVETADYNITCFSSTEDDCHIGYIIFNLTDKTFVITTGFDSETLPIGIKLTEAILQYLWEID